MDSDIHVLNNRIHNGNFDFLTACYEIKIDEMKSTPSLLSVVSCNPARFLETTASVLLYRIFSFSI